MLSLINAERDAAGLGPLVLGNNPAAQLHAEASLNHCLSSHWGLDGLKPYMRYSLSGGYQFNGENVLGLNYCLKESDGYSSIENIEEEIQDAMHRWMGSPEHRDNILDKWHKKVNIGLAWDKYNLKAVQHFEGDHVYYSRLPIIRDGTLSLSGSTRNGVAFTEKGDLGVQIYYDPPPSTLTRAQVAWTYCYDLGLPVAALRYPPGPDTYYPSDTYETLHERCPAPSDAPEDAVAPSSYIESRQLWSRAVDRSAEYSDALVQAKYITAGTWEASGESFTVRANVHSLLSEHGHGVYTLIVWATINDKPIAISQYSLFYGVVPPDAYSAG